MTLDTTQVLMTCNKKIATLLITILLLSLSCSTMAMQSGNVEYNAAAKLFDYSKLDKTPILQEADMYFDIALNIKNQKEKEYYTELALGKYFLVSKIDPGYQRTYVQLASLYDEMKKDTLAKSNFFHATNLGVNDPYTNYRFGEFYFKRRDYKRALKYYSIAYRNGYSQNPDLNFRMATIYEKFADLINAEKFYRATLSLNPQTEGVQEKIQSIQNLNYDNSEYYHFIRE